jgi:hypothetical protein
MKAQPDMGFEVPADNADFVPTTAVGHGTLLTGNANSFYVLSRSKRLQHLHSNAGFYAGARFQLMCCVRLFALNCGRLAASSG